jgi:hypothetical protein
MKLIDLTEGLSPVLYHTTSLNGVSSIVGNDEFRLTTTYANDSEQEVGAKKLFFLSTTRSKTGGYTLSNAYPHDAGNVVMELDGRALSNNYAGDPVQYWSRSWLAMAPEKDEMEDRIYNDKPTIPNATQYIKAIHILFKDKLNPRARTALIVLKKSGIPVWLYQDKQAYLLQDTRRAKHMSEFNLEPAEPQERYPRADRNAFDKQTKRREKKAGETTEHNRLAYGMSRWITLMATPIEQYDNIGRGMRGFVRGLQYGYNNAEARRILKSDLHNAKNDDHWNDKMFPLMKANKLKSADDIIDFIAQRWAPVAGE